MFRVGAGRGAVSGRVGREAFTPSGCLYFQGVQHAHLALEYCMPSSAKNSGISFHYWMETSMLIIILIKQVVDVKVEF
jgi:hypothetical protein